MMREDFENIGAKEQAIITADLLEEMYRDMQDDRCQRAYGIHSEQMKRQEVEQDIEFDRHTKAA